MKSRLALIFLLQVVSLIIIYDSGSAQELEVVNRPVNVSGLTGLIATTTPFTLPGGSLEIGASALNETSAVPDYSVTEYPLSITYGIARNMELALKGAYLYREEGLDPVRKRGAGDSELLYKWNFYPQQEHSLFPALAAFLSVTGLTGDSDAGLNRVHNWGARAGFSLGREIVWEDHVIGIYTDAQIAVQDLNQDVYRDKYSIVNAGILLPISKQHNLQLLVEYSDLSGKRPLNKDDTNTSTITYGIRVVSERFNLTVGNQFIHKEIEGYNPSGRVIGTLSIKFL